MFKFTNLAEIGSKVKVDIRRIDSKRLPNKLFNLLIEDPSAIVIDYKMTDGAGIGFILNLKDGSQIWCFDHEIENPYNGESIIDKGSLIPQEDIQKFKESISNELVINNQNQSKPEIKADNVFSFLNPFKIFLWFKFSLKDVF